MDRSRVALHGRLAVGLLLALLGLACGPAAPLEPSGFSLDYATGSVPPPYNHRYTIDVSFDEQGAQVSYQLEYLYRDKVTEPELRQLGYSPRDDIRWSGRFEADVAGRWQETARSSTLTGEGEAMPGADSLIVRVSRGEGVFSAGTPVDRTPWEQIAREVDHTARAELDVERSQP